MDLFDQKKPQALFTLDGDIDNLILIWGRECLGQN